MPPADSPSASDAPRRVLERDEGRAMEPQAAAELAQELTLVSAALFTQLRPGSAAHALSGVPGLATDGEAAHLGSPGLMDAATEPVRLPAQEIRPATSAPAISVEPVVPIPLVPTIPVDEVLAAPAVEPPVPVPAVAVPSVAVPTIPLVEMPVPVVTPVVEVESTEEPEPVATDPPHTDHRSMLMLDEIGFLDEEAEQ